MSNVIPFPGPPIDPENAPRKSDGSLLTECDEPVHVYAVIPGRCQCGKNLWPEGQAENESFSVQNVEAKLTQEVREVTGDETLSVHFDMTPLLRTEKRKRKWPEDFRGFLSNVRPRKQK